MMEKKADLLTQKLARRIVFSCAVALFAYTALRAAFMSFTHDESFTFLEYVRRSWQDVNNITYTNNHWLNTCLMKLMWERFGDSEFVLRLPNVIAHIIFLYYSAKLLFTIRHPLLTVSGWILVNCNPFVLDFFSLARGYGLSMGFMMMGFYGIYRLFFVSNNTRNLLLSLLPLYLAVMANLTLVNLVIGVTFLIGMGMFLTSKGAFAGLPFPKGNWWGPGLLMLLLTAIALDLVVPLLFSLRKSGNFDFGGDQGFWDDTVYSLTAASLYGTDSKGYWAVFLLKWTGMILLTFFALRGLYLLLISRRASREPVALAFFLLILLCFLAMELQHVLFGIHFSVDRAALYFIPLFSLFMVFAVSYMMQERWKRGLSLLFLFPALGLFAVSANLRYAHMWEYDSGTRDLVQRLASGSEKDGIKDPVIMTGVDFIFEPTFNYYRYRMGLEKIAPANHEEDPHPGNSHYYLVLFGDRGPYGRLVQASFPAGSCLVKDTAGFSLHPLSSRKLDYEDKPEMQGGIAGTAEAFSGSKIELMDEAREFSWVAYDTIKTDSLQRMVAVAGVQARRGKQGANALLVISVTRNGEKQYWSAVSTNEFVKRENIWAKVFYAVNLPPDLKKGDVVSAYLWNQSKYDLWLDDLQLDLYTAGP